MKTKQLLFFALLEDIEQILKYAELQINLAYFETGLLDTKNVKSYNSIFNVPNIGYTFVGDWNRIDSYLITKQEYSVNVRTVPQRKGNSKYAVDQMHNPESIELKLGGILKGSNNVLVAGRIATISEGKVSKELYKLFTTSIKKDFKKIGAFYVGKIAEEKLKSGWRLVTNDRSPKEYDLTLS